MDAQRWQRVERLFQRALEIEPEKRQSFLEEACGSDEECRAEVSDLLRHHDAAVSSLPVNQAPAATPDRISHYRVLSRLGEGGMGEVFLAEDEKLGRKVAIKRPRASVVADMQGTRRLLTEARAVAQLDHPHICGIYEVDEDASGPFIVMPVITGEPLSSRLKKGPLPIGEAVELAAQIADALALAHSHGVLHRDIKPANLIVTQRGHACVMDFGLAKFTGESSFASADPMLSQATAAGATIGTAAYMSPEQARGESVDGRSDVFSLGVVLYEMIAGRKPFDGSSLAEILSATQTAEPPPLARFRPETPDALQRIVTKTLRKSPGERYQSASDLLVDLRALRAELTASASGVKSQRVDGASVPTPHRDRWSRRASAVAALAFVLVAAAVSAIAWRASRASTRLTVGASARIGSIVVLPFANNSGHADSDYLADGITESLIRNLSQIPNLKVISRSTAFRFKGQSANAQKIASELGVRAVMTGSVVRLDDDVAIDVELSDAGDSSVLLSRQYVRGAAQVQQIEADVSRDTVTNLRVNLPGDNAEGLIKEPTTSAQAYRFYLRGRFFQSQFTPDSLHKAIDQYELALHEDPSFVLADAATAGTYVLLGTYFDSPTEDMTKARAYSKRALAIDPGLVEAHISAGMVSLLYDWDWAAAARELTTTAGVDPQATEAFSCTVHILEATGRVKDSERELRRALDMDPLSVELNTELGCNAYYRGAYDEAIRGEIDALKLDPRNLVASYNLARSYGQKGMYQDAITQLGKAQAVNGDAPPLVLSELGYAYGRSGDVAAANTILRKLTAAGEHSFVDPCFTAVVYMGLGDERRALDFLEKGYAVRSGFMTVLMREPKWIGVRADPRFLALVKRVGLV